MLLQVTRPIRFRRGYIALVLAPDGSPLASLIPVSTRTVAEVGVAFLRHDIEHGTLPRNQTHTTSGPKPDLATLRAAYAAYADHSKDMRTDPLYARVARELSGRRPLPRK